MQKQDIPYSQILSFLTQTDKRTFQSLNSTSKQLLLAQVRQLNVDPSLYGIEQFESLLRWLEQNKQFLVGIVKLRVNAIAEAALLSRIMAIFNQMEFKNLNELHFWFSVALNEELRGAIRMFFLKVKNIKILEITASILVIDFPNDFRFITHLSIDHDPWFPVEARRFKDFFLFNSWRHLRHLQITECNAEVFSCICSQLLNNKTKLVSLNLFSHRIDTITPPMRAFIKTQNLLKNCIATSEATAIGQRLQRLLILPGLERLHMHDVDSDMLQLIGTTCSQLKELVIDGYHFNKKEFQTFLKKNVLKKLKSYKGVIEFFPDDDVQKYLPSLESISYQLQTMNRNGIIAFLNGFKKMKSASISVSEFYPEIPILLQQFKNLTHLELDFDEDFPNIYQFIHLLNVLPLAQLRQLVLTVKNFHVQLIASFFLHLHHLEALTIYSIHDVPINRIEAERQIMSFLDILEGLDVCNKNVKEIDLPFFNDYVSIPDHRRRFMRIREKFPNIEKIRLGNGFFYFKPKYLF